MKHIRLAFLLVISTALFLFVATPAVALADATISGTVTDANSGDGVSNVYVSLYTQVDGVWSTTPTYSTTPDFSGQYTLTAPAGDYELCVYPSQWYQQWW